MKSCNICSHAPVCELLHKVEDLSKPYFSGYTDNHENYRFIKVSVFEAIANTCQFYKEEGE